jgi:uncharacterized phage-associated protein
MFLTLTGILPKVTLMNHQSIQFPYDKDRAWNAALWLLHHTGMQLSLMKLLKLVFLADLKHLLTFERPIIGGTYKAMTYGPVAYELYNDMKFPSPDSPFTFIPPYYVQTTSPVNEDFLSESDIKTLCHIYDAYGSMDAIALSNITHKFPLWKDRQSENDPIPYESFFLDIPEKYRQTLGIDIDQEDRDLILEIIRDRQEAWVMLK